MAPRLGLAAALALYALSGAFPARAAEPVLLDAATARVKLGSHVDILEDRDANLDVQQVLTSDAWRPSRVQTPNLGISHSAWWLRFSLRNATDARREWLLELDWPIADHVDLYERLPTGRFRVRREGDRLPFAAREVDYRSPVFPIQLGPGESATYWLRLRGGDAMMAPLVLWTPKAFHRNEIRETWGFGFYFGILFLLLVSNLLNYFTLRDRSHLYYVITLGSFAAWNLCIWGQAYQYLWPTHPDFSNLIINILPLTGMLAFVALTRHSLATAERTPILDRLLFFVTLGGILAGLPILALDVQTALLIAGPAFITVFVCCTAAAFLTWRQGLELARDYLIAWSATFVIITLWIIDLRWGAFSTDLIVDYGIQFAFVVTFTLLSWAIANRVRQLSKERDQARALMRASQKMARYFPRKLVERIIGDDEAVALDTERRNLTVFFIDLVGFTRLTDENEPERVAGVLNEYLTEMAALVEEHGGTVDKIMGDGMNGYFGAPDAMAPDEQARRAVAMAVAMQARVRELSRAWAREGFERELRLRIGINQEYVTVGNFGSRDLMSYTAIGGGVNLASRMESACSPGRILVSHSVYARTCEDWPYDPPREESFRGFARTWRVAELDPARVGEPDVAPPADHAPVIS